MAKSSNQKLKLLYLRQYLEQQSDETHPVSMQAMLEWLRANGICAERKSIYDDIDTLRLFGMDIVHVREGYYLAQRPFELAELKLLVDSVQASQFITHRKTLSLIRKLEGQCSRYQAQGLQRQVMVANRVKHMNESIYYHVDALHSAIAQDRQITFRYFEYTVSKERSYRHGGALYCVSPYALTWDNENYYLIGYDAGRDMIRHYRVDKMEGIALVDQPRVGRDAFAQLDMAAYTRRTFSMYGGEERPVELRFENRLAGVVLDRFGKDVSLIKDGEAHFLIRQALVVSPQFFGWLFGLGAGACLTGPQNVVEELRKYLEGIGALYSLPKEL
ncbi:MAG: WYL domain-containing protein [Eubacteriales bacterium]|nr:WYL domain-containing protein [Eubacteriales bacterium]